jgi:hypothetical protein
MPRRARAAVRPAFERLLATLDEDEALLDAAAGTFLYEPGHLAVTDRQVVFGMEMPLFRFVNSTVRIRLETVRRVGVEHHAWGARVRVVAPAASPVIGGLEPHRADALADLIRERAGQSGEPVPGAPEPQPRARGLPPLVVAGYVLALLMPVAGLLLGVVALTRADPRVRGHGAWIVAASVAALLLYLALYGAGIAAR